MGVGINSFFCCFRRQIVPKAFGGWAVVASTKKATRSPKSNGTYGIRSNLSPNERFLNKFSRLLNLRGNHVFVFFLRILAVCSDSLALSVSIPLLFV